MFKVGDKDHDEILCNYFQEFDYDPTGRFKLMELHEQNTFSIYDEEYAVFRVVLRSNGHSLTFFDVPVCAQRRLM
ncbi:hypothetical protein AGMMS49573_00920 [Endomicrobiia bacterium]|uniref:hypothetical protein n=1 Tax=Endomicrobium trichonymphae TaxID=1408204 RepID=UPI000BBA45C5|nr:hypothetical protein [Candidatus Endomicrobium trichonymphae]GHT06221.1 hypothetical protein AGMMS49523_07350 [Endomicrobiia bacterium]GHT09459.1 hypothetical protein AGMMS49532_07540 [Endomicrobiia bacterium]GHT14587.1 hypothetical protein AGMMS49571_10530 [Endomicrobiia bacterium]GHT15197.1 hypothetical protein AGMMS49573_00920 [Endomicrobiia bacterium]GHT18693.1 hypothetical protein AGMMS49929_00850 [Endomicrobiia bacterium]